MTSLRFPTCWDGVNLDSPDHMSHMSYPDKSPQTHFLQSKTDELIQSGTFESAGPCPASHPVRVSQVMYEVIWDTKQFNNKEDWPEDGKQPFVWSFGDATGYANHGDYLFGWKGDSLQKILDKECYVQCNRTELGQTQSIADMNKCANIPPVVDEDIDGCEYIPGAAVKGCLLTLFESGLAELPGGHHAQYE